MFIDLIVWKLVLLCRLPSINLRLVFHTVFTDDCFVPVVHIGRLLSSFYVNFQGIARKEQTHLFYLSRYTDKCQQSRVGSTVSRVLAALDALDRHHFDKWDDCYNLDILYRKIFEVDFEKRSEMNDLMNFNHVSNLKN